MIMSAKIERLVLCTVEGVERTTVTVLLCEICIIRGFSF